MVKADKIILTIDIQEKTPLDFPSREIETVTEHLKTGDYTMAVNGKMIKRICERKEKGDLFGSFSGERYVREKAKIMRAKEDGCEYLLAIEASMESVRQGHRYYKSGQWHESGKDGLSQLRQLYTLEYKYGISIAYFNSRESMAFGIQEWLMTPYRLNPKEYANG